MDRAVATLGTKGWSAENMHKPGHIDAK
jgi:hypothetical protein